MITNNISTLSTNWSSITAALITITVCGIGLSVSLPLLSMLFELRGVSSFLIGVNTALSTAGSIAISPFVTPLALRFGVFRLMIFAVIIAAILLLSFFWITNFWLIIIARFGFHAAIAIIIILSEFWINITVSPDRRGVVLGIYATMFSLGFMIGSLILKITTNIHSITPLLYSAIIFIFALIPIFIARQQIPQISKEEKKTAFWQFFNQEPLAMITVFIFAISESGLLSIFPVYGLRIGYQPQEFATFLLAMGLGNVVFQIPIGFLIDRINKILLFISFALLGFIGAVIIPFISHNVIVFTIIVFFWGGIIPGLYTLGLSRIGSRFDGAELAAANSVFVMNYSIGMLVGPVIVGFGMNSWNPHGAMWIMALIFGLYSIYILSFRFFATSKIG